MPKTRILPSMPAMMLEGRTRSLVVSDIHIGFESSFAANDIFIGKKSTINNTISELTEMIQSEKPDNIVLLGDVKSGIRTISRQEWDEVPMFFDRLKEQCDVILVPGNHDANIHKLVPDGISMISHTGMTEGNVLLTHGHTMPSENFSYVDRIIMGHIHPVFIQEGSVLNGQRVWVSIKAEKQQIFPGRSGIIEIMIVPSFNRYFYATHKKRYKRSTSPIIERVRNIEAAMIVTLDGTFIGDESLLECVL